MTNYRQVRKLVGGPLGTDKKALPLATTKGLRGVGVRAMSPRAIATDVWKNIRATRPGMTRREWAREVFRPWGETFDPLSRIDPKLLKAKNVSEYLALAERYRRRAKVVGIADRGLAVHGVYQEGRSFLAGGSDDPSRELQGAPLPRAEIDEARMSDAELADRRRQALADIGYTRQVVPVPVRARPVPGVQQDAVPS